MIENAQMDIPEAMIETQTRQMLDDFARRMQSQGLSMEQYFQFTGQSVDKMMEDMKPQALKRIQTRLVLEKVAEAENIQPSEEEITEEIQKMADTFTEGYRIGFELTGKDLSKKKTVNIRYCLGFERLVRAEIKNFEKLGLKPTIYRAAVNTINKRLNIKVGYYGDKEIDFVGEKNGEKLYIQVALKNR